MNDKPENEVMDIVYYCMYGFSGYFFLYFYVHWKLSGILTLVYIVLWSLFAYLYELAAQAVDIFDFSKGYDRIYSFPIYLYIQSFFILFFHFITKEYGKLKQKF
ncbi:hypothetical protein [Metabacillus herbersteinensis]|uniref:hypothetical protein n=1 Tax=Metabacillus herbersteinensis TaxID=283816 RepID=UPI003671C66B